MAGFPFQKDATLKQALRVGLVYLVVSAAWIWLSDAVVERLVTDPGEIRRLQTWKGWAFVLASAALIVALVRAELVRVRQASRRVSALVDQAIAGIYLIRGGRFLFVNRALAETFGREPDEMTDGLEVADVIAERDRDMVLSNLTSREEGRSADMHYRFTAVRRDGEEVRVEVHGTPVDWEGAPAVLGVLLEVDERERLERQVRESRKMEAMGKLTGQIAHDFNNFLTAIVGPLDLCLDRLEPGTPEHVEVLEARESAVRAAELSRKLLAFSQSRPSVPRIIDLNETLEEMGMLLDRLVGPSIRLRRELDPEPCLVSIDPAGLEQVVMNLVMNAGEAIDGRGTVSVRSGHDSGGGAVSLEVEDDGEGMEPERQARIFEPFFTSKPRGTGLGLSTVFGIVDQAGGAVSVRSEPGAGSVFRVRFPAAHGEPVRRRRPAQPTRPTGRGERVLVVEDEPAILRTITRALERFGYEVVGAGTGEEALDVAGRPDERIDLLLTDVQLPDAFGTDVAERIVAARPGLRVLFMSGYSDAEISSRLTHTPGIRLLEKPFSIDELLAAVRGALEEGDAEGVQAG